MAYAALVSLLPITDQFLDLNLCFFPFTSEKIESFRETIGSLLAFLDKCPPICSQEIHDLITEIRNVCYEAEDVLESLIATHFLRKDGSRRCRQLKRFREISFEQIAEKLEMIEAEAKKIRIDEGSFVHEQRISALSGPPRTALRGNNSNLAALDNDMKMKLMEQLVSGCSKINVVPIVGMGGIGKTTLARILFDTKLIKESFDICGWVTVTQTYRAQEVVLGILKDLGVPLDRKKDAELQLYQYLCGRKYMIVLDDVWDTQALDYIKRSFPENRNGSRIILTTRHSKVAAYANSFGTYHEMQLLDEDSSWSLLCQEVFPQQNCPPDLVEIGKEIARQCHGLPLAISAIGGHLKKEKHTKEYWEFVSRNVSLVLKRDNDPALEILTLSYNYLPHHLKACFLYFGVFKEDCSVEIFRIVNLWVAEGFVKPSTSNSIEQVAEEYLSDIIERNLVFVHKYDSFGKPKRCGIHDLFRDICIREASKENLFFATHRYADQPFDFKEKICLRRFIVEDEGTPSMDRTPSMDGNLTIRYYYEAYHVSDSSSSSDVDIEYDGDISSYLEYDGDISTTDRPPANELECRCNVMRAMLATRSLICYDDCAAETIKLASGLLKVLNIASMRSTKFPMEILEFVNLKYLHLGNIGRIPSSISRLRNLQTLIIRAMRIKSMPSEIWEMKQLRHIVVGGFHLLNIPDVRGKGENYTYVLESLRTLSEVVDFTCEPEVVARIPNVKELKLLYSKDATGWSFGSLNNLVRLRELESLRLDFWPHEYNLGTLAFPSSLKKLVLLGSRIPWEQMTIVGVLPELEILKLRLRSNKGKIWETNDGEFTKLKFLLIELAALVEWKTERDHFPSLQHLILRNCPLLEAIPYEIGEIPTLEKIEVIECSETAEASAKEVIGEVGEIKLIISKDTKKEHSVTSRYFLDFIGVSLCESIKESCCVIL
ncbi:hypothetical protein F511_31121 [Dorcoceras hygrometricum]|uniref:Uncharacterized protein n=1 Tax=Dorcoceras hygrometricum TaxID=472368 RepID=A0A2Z7AGF4_9LAMI|nr:hypothetical protein F511_31121 [Dorcoceras hygrometricum]